MPRFPAVASHDDVRCYVCDGPTDTTQDAGFAPRDGQYRRACVRGHGWTYYDLSPVSPEAWPTCQTCGATDHTTEQHNAGRCETCDPENMGYVCQCDAGADPFNSAACDSALAEGN